MSKRILSIILAAALFIQATPVFASTHIATTYQNEVSIMIDSQRHTLTAYNIDGYNYFRLRDICKPLDFSVEWNSSVHSVWVDTSKAYAGAHDDYIPPMKTISLEVKDMEVYINGVGKQISSCNIEGYNYFKLRDIADLSKNSAYESKNHNPKCIIVDWDNASQTTIITTHIGALVVTVQENNNTESIQPNINIVPTAPRSEMPINVVESLPPVTAPMVGSQLAKILIDESVSPYNADGSVNRDNFHGAYWVGNIGQCTWYAKARFYEALGVDNYTYTMLFTSVGKGTGVSMTAWLDNADMADLPSVYSIREAKGIIPHSIAIWDAPNAGGHVVFVEYVEYDSNGNPTEVYFSEANQGAAQTYRQGIDGTIQKLSFTDFINRGSSSEHVFKGYIAAK